MRVLLVSANTATTPYPVYPIGCSMIAAALINAGHEVCQFDYLKQDNSLDALSQSIEEFSPELIGISIRNIDNVNLLNEQCYIESVKDIVKKIREVTYAKVVLGGPGFSLIPDFILKETSADYGIIGEGESLMVDFTNNAANKTYPAEPLVGPETRHFGKDIPSAKYDDRLME